MKNYLSPRVLKIFSRSLVMALVRLINKSTLPLILYKDIEVYDNEKLYKRSLRFYILRGKKERVASLNIEMLMCNKGAL